MHTHQTLRLLTAALLGACLAGTAHAQGAATLDQPLGIAVDRAGNLYVANANAGVTIYNQQHKLIGQITGGVSGPTSVGVTFAGEIHVANGGTHTITIYNQAYAQTGTISDPNLAYPTSMYVDANDDTWVVDNAGYVHAYLANLSNAVLFNPGVSATAIGAWGPNISLWGTNGSGTHVELTANVGESLHNTNFTSSELQVSVQAGGEAQDDAGNQYVTDQAGNSVVLITASATNRIVSTPSSPYGIAVDSVRGKFYVSYPQTYTVGVYSLRAPYKLLATIH